LDLDLSFEQADIELDLDFGTAPEPASEPASDPAIDSED
jgi:hypothetical protein